MTKKKIRAQGVRPRKHLTQRLKILVVDDSLHVRRQLVDALQAHGVSVAPDAAVAKHIITAERPHICFIDLDLGDPNDVRSGLPVIAAAKRSGAYAVVLTNYDDAETRDLAHRMGCDEFHSKREGLQSVPATISRYLAQHGSYLTNELYEYGQQHGLYQLLDLVTDLVIRRNLDENGGVVRPVLKNLRIGTALLYRSLRGVPTTRRDRSGGVEK